jgi:2-acylglycerol O-acyltransferase 2
MEVLFLLLLLARRAFAGYFAALLGFLAALAACRLRRAAGAAVALAGAALAAGGSEPAALAAAGAAAALLYAPSYYDGAERTGARASRWFRRLRFWRALRWWTGFEARWPDPGPDGLGGIAGPAVVAVHPHGFLPVSAAIAFALVGAPGPVIPGLARDPLLAVTSLLFLAPGVRELALWSGCVDASRDVLLELLRAGRVVVLAPGGIREGVEHDHDVLRLYFGHVGFLSLARRAGARVFPAFASGENRLWVAAPGLRTLRAAVASRLLYPFPMLFLPVPFPHKLALLVGPAVDGVRDAADLAGASEAFESAVWSLVESCESPEDYERPARDPV